MFGLKSTDPKKRAQQELATVEIQLLDFLALCEYSSHMAAMLMQRKERLTEYLAFDNVVSAVGDVDRAFADVAKYFPELKGTAAQA